MFPFWEVPTFTSGIFIALIASFHILPSHLATGAFWFVTYLEYRSIKENKPHYMDFIKKFTLMILIFCFVLGSITGVGIWFSATIASPRGISALIHNYVWGWATEWVFFIIETVAIYVYYYTLGKIDSKTHLKIGITYAFASWISMVIITGILAFQLTPGKWIETGGFFDGFFNETYWPQLFFRTALMFVIASVYATLVASFIKEKDTRGDITFKASLFGIAGFILMALFSFWYIYKLPGVPKSLDFAGVLAYMKILNKLLVFSSTIVVGYLVYCIIFPRYTNPFISIGTIVVLFFAILGFEGIREGIRRPYIIYNYIYSNNIIARDLPAKGIKAIGEKMNQDGFLSTLYLIPDDFRKITPKNRLEVGRIITLYQCGNCHSMEKKGVLRPLPKYVKNLGMSSPEELAGYLDALEGYPYMPPFFGTDEEKLAVGSYLSTMAN